MKLRVKTNLKSKIKKNSHNWNGNKIKTKTKPNAEIKPNLTLKLPSDKIKYYSYFIYGKYCIHIF